jgi:cyclophilin family peptidyl-prolyl cis-trans isomerase
MRERRRPVVPLAALAVGAALALAGCGGSGSAAEETETETETTTVEQTATDPNDPSLSSFCEPVPIPEPRDEPATAPSDDLDPETTYALTFETNCGAFTITLDQETAPETAASLVHLARDGYFDDTVFHRIVPGFVIQGGDPTQTGGGGPGYSTVDVPPDDARYVKGVVAMAKTGAEPPGTAGSQFFVVTGSDAGLPPEYAVVGQVSDGLDTVELIGELGDPASELPLEPIVISTVTVDES